jgi:large subunit ribosomal protein L25
MADSALKVNNRTVTGKKTRFLRREGLTPAHLFGHGVESLAVQVKTGELQRTIARKGTTRLLDIKVEGEQEARSVFIREIQRNALSGELVHVDFYQVNKNEKIRVAVPVVLMGEAPASKLKNNFVEQLLNELEVESLPADLPPQIEVDIASLAQVDDAIHVRDLPVRPGVVIVAGPDQLLVKVSAIAEEKEEVVVAAAPTEEAAAAAPAEGEAPKADKGEKVGEKPEKKS